MKLTRLLEQIGLIGCLTLLSLSFITTAIALN